jgi:patatin-like phospholipase/acyl hydrolase
MVVRKRILSIDGGGVRGVIPAVWLAKLEEDTGIQARDHFDFLAGTSTGAVIAGALAVGVRAEDLVGLYQTRSNEIFAKVPVLGQIVRFFSGTLYSVATLNRVLREVLAEKSGNADWTLNEITNNDVLITSKRLGDGQPYYFVKDREGEKPGKTGKLLLSDCVTASAAAPTYFGPWEIKALASETADHKPVSGEMVDGGTGVAGNPVYKACVEAFEFNSAKYTADDSTVIVSLGTGRYLEPQRPRWLPAWFFWILAELLRSPAEQQSELVQRHYPGARFYRIDVALPRDFPLDRIKDLGELGDIARKHLPKIHWDVILAGGDDEHLISEGNVRPKAYAKAV